MRTLFVLAIFTVLIEGCTVINKRLGWNDDHVLEEYSEKVIHSQTGWDVDLTPSSPEEGSDKVEFPFFDW